MAKKNLVIFGFDTMFAPDGNIVPWVLPFLDSKEILKIFVASADAPGFEWPKLVRLTSRGSFSGHCVSTTQSTEDRMRLLANLIRWIDREHDVHKKFFFVRSDADFNHGNSLGLLSVKVDDRPLLPEQFLLI